MEPERIAVLRKGVDCVRDGCSWDSELILTLEEVEELLAAHAARDALAGECERLRGEVERWRKAATERDEKQAQVRDTLATSIDHGDALADEVAGLVSQYTELSNAVMGTSDGYREHHDNPDAVRVFYDKIEALTRERDEARSLRTTYEHASADSLVRAERAEKERDEAREAITEVAEAIGMDVESEGSVTVRGLRNALARATEVANQERDAALAREKAMREALENLIYRIGASIGDEVSLKRSIVCSELRKILAASEPKPEGGDDGA